MDAGTGANISFEVIVTTLTLSGAIVANWIKSQKTMTRVDTDVKSLSEDIEEIKTSNKEREKQLNQTFMMVSELTSEYKNSIDKMDDLAEDIKDTNKESKEFVKQLTEISTTLATINERSINIKEKVDEHDKVLMKLASRSK